MFGHITSDYLGSCKPDPLAYQKRDKQTKPVIRVRFAEPEELSSLYIIESSCFTEDFRWDEDDFVKALTHCDVWVAERIINEGCNCEAGPLDIHDHKEIIGMLAGKQAWRSGYVMSVATLPKFQGYGAAGAMMLAAESYYASQKLKRMRLEVHVDNPAQVLYFKLGYRVKAIHPKYYANGDPCLVMTKEITGRNSA